MQFGHGSSKCTRVQLQWKFEMRGARAHTWRAEMSAVGAILGGLTAASDADSTMRSGCGMPICMYLGTYYE
jgi:hypothetical protein